MKNRKNRQICIDDINNEKGYIEVKRYAQIEICVEIVSEDNQ